MGLAELRNVPRIDRVSVVEQVSNRLLELILDGELRAGESISEDEVKNQLGVSRVTARSALAELINTGVLEKEPNRTARVKVMTYDETNYVFRARLPIEIEAIRYLTQIGVPVLPEVAQSIDALRLSEGGGENVRIGHNLDFHKYIVYSSANPWLMRSYDAIEGGLKLALAQSDSHPTCAQTADQHEELLALVSPPAPEETPPQRRARFAKARKAFLDHVDAVKSEVAGSLEN